MFIAASFFEMTPVEWMIVVSCAGSVSCAFFLIMQIMIAARQHHALANQGEVLITETTSGMIRSFMPIARSIGLGIYGLLGSRKKVGLYNLFRTGIEKKLFAAGTPQGINADEYVGFTFVWGSIAGMFGVLIHVFFDLDTTMSIYSSFILWGGMAVMWWRSWLSTRKEQRQKSIRRALPFTLDLLTLSMEAGLDFTTALRKIVKKVIDTPLGREFSLMLHEIQLGKARTQALRDFAARVDLPEVRTVVASLIQADELGAPLGPVLRIQAGQQREKRSQRAEEQAMKAPVKMLFPLTVFIFPTVLIMLFVPIILKVMKE